MRRMRQAWMVIAGVVFAVSLGASIVASEDCFDAGLRHPNAATGEIYPESSHERVCYVTRQTHLIHNLFDGGAFLSFPFLWVLGFREMVSRMSAEEWAQARVNLLIWGAAMVLGAGVFLTFVYLGIRARPH